MKPGINDDFWQSSISPFCPTPTKRGDGREAYDLILQRQRELCRESRFIFENRLSQFFADYFAKAEKMLKNADIAHIRLLKSDIEYRNELRQRARSRAFREANRRLDVVGADPGFEGFKREADDFDSKVVGVLLSRFYELEQQEQQNDPLAFLGL